MRLKHDRAQQGCLGAASCEHAKPDEQGEQGACGLVRTHVFGDFAKGRGVLRLRAEEGLHFDEGAGDDLRHLRIVGRQLECGVDQQTAFARAALQGHRYGRLEHIKDRPARRRRGYDLGHPALAPYLVVATKRVHEQGMLTAELVVQAGAPDPHARYQVGDRCLVIALLPEQVHGLGQDFVDVELADSGHGRVPALRGLGPLEEGAPRRCVMFIPIQE